MNIERLRAVLSTPLPTSTAAWLIGTTPDAMRMRRMRHRSMNSVQRPDTLQPVTIDTTTRRRRVGYRLADLIRYTLDKLTKRESENAREAAK